MLVVILISALSLFCNCQPMNKEEVPPPEAGNLKFTFGSQDEIPSAFFDTSAQGRESRRAYPACQDGSGGMCVDAGQCPPDLRPETNNTAACPPGLECCFGPAANDNSCGSRGGQCVSSKECGKSPIFALANDCDRAKGEVCCIFI